MIQYLNQTLINRWMICPESVRRIWIEGDIIPPGIAARIGTGLHKGAEVNHRGKLLTGKDEPLDVVQDAARDGYIKSLQDGGVFFAPEELPSAKKQMAEGVDTAVSLASTYHESLAPLISPMLVEEEIYMAVSDLPIPFRGTVDIYTTDSWWADIKSAGKKWATSREHHEVQATLYNELIRERTGEYPKKLSYEIFTKSKGEHITRPTKRTGEDFSLLVRRVQLMLKQIDSGIFQPADPSSWACNSRWCGYFFTCSHIPSYKKILPKRSA